MPEAQTEKAAPEAEKLPGDVRTPADLDPEDGRKRAKHELALALKPEHKRLAEAYVRLGMRKDLAAIECGWSGQHVRKGVAVVLANPAVQLYVRYLMLEKAKADQIDDAWIISRLAEEATGERKGSSGAVRVRALEALARIKKLDEKASTTVIAPVKVFVGIDASQV